jgi:multiple sugar transport system substrate-binding protein
MPKMWSCRLLSLVLIALLVGACAPQAVPQGPWPVSPAPVLADLQAAPERGEKAGRSVIVWLVPAEWSNLEYVVAEFEAANPDIWVEIQQVAADSLAAVAEEALTDGDTTPDVLCVDSSLAAYYGGNGWLEPLWGAFTFDQKQDWIRAARLTSERNRDRYSAPLTASTQLLFFNEELLHAQGVKPPSADERWTWEKVVSAAQKLTVDENADGIPEVWGIGWERSGLAELASLAQSVSGQPIDWDGLKTDGALDVEAWSKALEFYAAMFGEWGISPRTAEFDAVASFANGELAMLLGSDAELARFARPADEGGLPFRWGVAPYPYFKKGMVASPVGGWNVGVNARSEEREAALRFVVWLTTNGGAEKFWRYANMGLPAQKTILTLILHGADFEAPPWSFLRVAASQAMENMGILPITPAYRETDQLLQGMLAELRVGNNVPAGLEQALGMLVFLAEE